MATVSELTSKNIASAQVNVQTWGDIIINVKVYGAKGDGVTDDTIAIQAAIDAVGEQGGIVYFPNGNYRITQTINVKKDTIIEGNGSEIILDGNVSISFEGEVTELSSSFSSSVSRGSLSINVTDGSVINENDLLILTDTADFSFSDYRASYNDGEFVEVMSVTDNTVTLKSQLETSYGTTDNFKIYKVDPVSFEINNLAIKKANNFTGDNLFLYQTKNSVLRNIVLENSNANDCLFIARAYKLTCYNVNVVNKSTNIGDFGYGVVIRASQFITFYDSSFLSRRHASSVGSGGIGYPSQITRHINFYNCVFKSFSTDGNTHAADFHGSIKNGYYHNCIFYGGVVLGGEDVGVYGGEVYSKGAQGGLFIREIKGGKIDYERVTYFSENNDIPFGYHSSTELNKIKKDVTFNIDDVDLQFSIDAPSNIIVLPFESVNNSNIIVNVERVTSNKTPTLYFIQLIGGVNITLKSLYIKNITTPTITAIWYRVVTDIVKDSTRVTLPELTVNDTITLSGSSSKTLILPTRFQHKNISVLFTVYKRGVPSKPLAITMGNIVPDASLYYYYFTVYFTDILGTITVPETVEYSATVLNNNVKPII